MAVSPGAKCATTTPSSQASTRSPPSTWTCPAARRGREKGEALVEGSARLREMIKAGVPPAYEIRGVAS